MQTTPRDPAESCNLPGSPFRATIPAGGRTNKLGQKLGLLAQHTTSGQQLDTKIHILEKTGAEFLHDSSIYKTLYSQRLEVLKTTQEVPRLSQLTRPPLLYHFLSCPSGIHFDFVPTLKYEPKAGHHDAILGIFVHPD